MVAPEKIDLLITGGYVVSMDAEMRSHYPGSIVVHDGFIQAVGPSDGIDPQFDGVRVVDASDHVVMPGLVNVHGHASNSLIRGLGGELDLQDWIFQVGWPIMVKATDEDLFNATRLCALEMLGNGVTTFADMWHSVGSAAEAVKASGLRGILAYNMKDFADQERGERELQAALEAVASWNGYANDRVSVGLGPHSVYLCQPELLEACGREAHTQGIQIQIHASENQREVDECRSNHEMRSPIQLLSDLGLLGENTIAAHVVCVDDVDIRLLKQSNTAIAHNIISNLKLASGVAPVPQFMREGLRVGMGTDGPGSNDTLDMLKDLKAAILVQRGVSKNAGIMSSKQALRMATIDGADALGMSDLIGSLESGKKADLILIDMDKPHFTPRHYGHEESIYSLLLFCATGADVDYVIVDGDIVLDQGEVVTLDPIEVKRDAQESSQRLLKEAGFL